MHPREQTSIRRYILAPDYAFRGWRLLPFGIQHRSRPVTEFFLEERYRLLMACDGLTDILWDDLTEEKRSYYERWEENRLIRRAEPGERLLDYQNYRFYDARYKQTVQWSITGRCNYKCRHCFMSAPHAAQGEPTWEQLMTMLDAFQRCGVRDLHITGGEPMVRSDFWDLIDEICRRDFRIDTLYSNGLLVTDGFLDKLEERGLKPSIQFSFDGVGHHDWMRGVGGVERIAVEAIRRCRARGFSVSASMVLCRESVGCIRESVNFLASLGVGHIKVGAAYPQGEWLNEPEHCLSREELFEAFLAYIPQYFEDGRPVSIGLEGFFSFDLPDKGPYALHEKGVREEFFPKAQMCAHVRKGMYVSPQGNVLPCMSMVGTPIEERFPNMLKTPLEEILAACSLYMDIICFTVEDFMNRNPECRECEYREECCGGCRATAVRDHPADYLAKDPEVCEYFKGGWKEKKDSLLRELGVYPQFIA